MKKLIILFAVIFLFGCASIAPIPDDIKIVSVKQEVPQNIANYLGVWQRTEVINSGPWVDTSKQDLIVVIEEIDPPMVRAVYSWGDYSGIERAGWRRFKGEIVNNFIIFNWMAGTSPRKLTLRPGKALDEIRGEYEKTPGVIFSSSTFKKVKNILNGRSLEKRSF